ncbi:MAG: penicillin-binding transpeptidase domain-containing protein [Gammaproteobacteria bacterium]
MKRAGPRNVDLGLALRIRRWRGIALLVGFALMAAALEGRMFYLQVVNKEFLSAQGNDRHLNDVKISAHRGSITDRHGEMLAVSTPVDSIGVDPHKIKPELGRLAELARALEMDEGLLERRITSSLDKKFILLRRHMRPDFAARVMQLGIPGLETRREYHRYYPSGEVTGHVIGFTDIDDWGQEGLELAFNHWLKGEDGVKRVMKDRLERIIQDVELVSPSRPGRTLVTSLDLRLQYLAYRELQQAVVDKSANAGSVVILDVDTGEVLAMVNQPSYNPNNRAQLQGARIRNRAVTDIFEPGSSFKPLIIAAALESGRYQADSLIDTSPGFIEVGGNFIITDTSNLGEVDVTTVLAKSSNVGITKIALDLERQSLWTVLSDLGIGRATMSGFPGESAGVLNDFQHWRPVGQATLAYGYGVSVTALQLARAYATIAAGGIHRPVSMLAAQGSLPIERVISPATSAALMGMLEVVVSPAGTGSRAAIPGYRVAGKTGTTKKSGIGGYSENSYIAVFVGVAPVTDPKLVVVVVIDEPRTGVYSGGEVAAPVFANITSGALRLLALTPDNLQQVPLRIVANTEVNL